MNELKCIIIIDFDTKYRIFCNYNSCACPECLSQEFLTEYGRSYDLSSPMTMEEKGYFANWLINKKGFMEFVNFNVV